MKLLKRPGQGIGARLGSSGRGVFVKQVHKNAPTDMDGELGPGVFLCGVCACVGYVLIGCKSVNFLPTSWCCSGDRVLSVNGQRVWHHRQASELIRSGPVVVSLLVEKTDRDRLPDLSEGLAGGGGLKHIGQWGCTSSTLGEAGHSVQCSSHFTGELETSMNGAKLSGWLATFVMEDTIPEEADEVAPQPVTHFQQPHPLSHTLSLGRELPNCSGGLVA